MTVCLLVVTGYFLCPCRVGDAMDARNDGCGLTRRTWAVEQSRRMCYEEAET